MIATEACYASRLKFPSILLATAPINIQKSVVRALSLSGLGQARSGRLVSAASDARAGAGRYSR
jgi:hypothetical protein